MIALFCDFGLPYTAQMRAAIRQVGASDEIVDLLTDAPRQGAQPSAYLLPSLAADFVPGTIFVCVVDPGVGSDRAALVIRTKEHWFVGPDNGLFEIVFRRAGREARCWEIMWRPESLSATFHGRDLFAPVAARIAQGETLPGRECGRPGFDAAGWPDDLAEIVYIDDFGNAMTGIRMAAIPAKAVLTLQGRILSRARTFSDVPEGRPFWYENAIGLVEIAVNGGNAASDLDLRVGSPVAFAN